VIYVIWIPGPFWRQARRFLWQCGFPTALSVRDGCSEQHVALILRERLYAAAAPPLHRIGGAGSELGDSRARLAPDQGLILSGKRRYTPLHGKPSKLTIAITGSTVLTAAAASGVVALWPVSVAVHPVADSTKAASGASAGLVRLDADGTITAQQLAKANFAQRGMQANVLSAQEAAAREAAARKRAAAAAATAARAAQ
jgi:hypothetical protein